MDVFFACQARHDDTVMVLSSPASSRSPPVAAALPVPQAAITVSRVWAAVQSMVKVIVCPGASWAVRYSFSPTRILQ